MKATNILLEQIASTGIIGGRLESEPQFTARAQVGRAVARSVFARLEVLGVIRRTNRQRLIVRAPRPGDFYGANQTESRPDLVRRRFLDLTLNGGLQPGQLFSESEVARSFGASTISIREF